MGNWLREFGVQLYEQTVHLAPKIAAGAVIFLIFLGAGRIGKMLLCRACVRARIDHNLVLLLSGTLHIAVIIFGIVTALGTMGVNIGALIAGLGLSGFALSFALKDGLSNLLAGISILLYRPFCVGDCISVTGLEGQVVRIEVRYTMLKAKDTTILIPNANLFTNSILVFNSKEEFKTRNRIKNA